MTWWCAALGEAWTWTWRPYPGVWLFILFLAVGYARWRRHPGGATGRGRVLAFGAGLVLLWLASDWPIGTLGAGYLLGIHTVQYVLYSFAAPPLLLAGLDPARIATVAGPSSRRGKALRFLGHPLVALAVFNLVLFVSHAPPVVDGLRTSQVGSFLMDMAWLAGGAALWWPVLAPAPAVSRLTPPGALVYLFISTILPTVPAAFFIFADYPIYALYELAPRVAGIPATTDQLVAGLTMKVGGDIAAWTAMIVVFLSWVRREDATDRRERAARAGGGVG